jgi:hypothetical protein
MRLAREAGKRIDEKKANHPLRARQILRESKSWRGLRRLAHDCAHPGEQPGHINRGDSPDDFR